MRTRELAEAEDLLVQISTWSEDEVEALPMFYRRKAREYRDRAERLGLG